jgi:FdhD protein
VVQVSRHRGGQVQRDKDSLSVEEPLEIRVAWGNLEARAVEALAVTMRTPGDDFDLVAGFLLGEGILDSIDGLQELTYCRGQETQEYNVVEARLRPGISFDLDRLRRNVFTSSSCGVCGKTSLEAVAFSGCTNLEDELRVEGALLPGLPDRLLEGQGVFAQTGGLHAAGLFGADGELYALREDVGRHNAVDKVLGKTFLDRKFPADDRILVVSGRASFEIVQKALMARVPVLVAVGAPSSLAVDLSEEFGQTLVGFARGDGFNVYCGNERLI